MKKLWESIKDKAIAGVVWFMLSTGIVFLYNVGQDIWNLPKTVKELKHLHTQDSLHANVYMHKIDSIIHYSWKQKIRLRQDSLNIQLIKNKLKIH